jgi:hypothetical protein
MDYQCGDVFEEAMYWVCTGCEAFGQCLSGYQICWKRG